MSSVDLPGQAKLRFLLAEKPRIPSQRERGRKNALEGVGGSLGVIDGTEKVI